MGLFSKAKPEPRRLLFATDLHGSTVAFRKLLAAPKLHRVEALVCGGELTGKCLCLIEEIRDGRYVLHGDGRAHGLDGHAALADAKAKLEASGAYPATLMPDEYEAIRDDAAARDALLSRLVKARLEEWIALAEDSLAGSGVRCYVTGGNDDASEVLEPLARSGSAHVVAAEGHVVDVLGHPMVSLGWSNPTPRDTPREATEAELARMIAAAISPLRDAADAIFNFHAPPRDPALEPWPKLDRNARSPTAILRADGLRKDGAGSIAVAAAIREHQPLVGLHGHLRESAGVTRLGRTVCVNPGSEYRDAALRGAIVALLPGRVVSYQLTRS